ATVVWIATKFREEHRAAVDWLNANTNDQFDFFAVEVELAKIGSSLPAPRFNMVAKPNNWSRSNRQIAQSPLNETTQLYLAYWAAFRDFWLSKKPNGHPPEVRPSHVYRCATLRPGFALNAVAGRSERWLRMEVYIQIKGDAPKLALRALKKDEAAI